MSSPELSDLLNSIRIMRSELSDYWEDSDCTSDGSEDLVGESITYHNSDGEPYYPPDYPHPDLVDYAQTDFGRCKILLFSTIIRRNCEVKVTEKYLIYMWRFKVAIF